MIRAPRHSPRSRMTRELSLFPSGGGRVAVSLCPVLTLFEQPKRVPHAAEQRLRLGSIAATRLRSYVGFWVTRRSGGVVCRHLDDLDAVLEFDTCDDLRQVICTFESPPGL